MDSSACWLVRRRFSKSAICARMASRLTAASGPPAARCSRVRSRMRAARCRFFVWIPLNSSPPAETMTIGATAVEMTSAVAASIRQISLLPPGSGGNMLAAWLASRTRRSQHLHEGLLDTTETSATPLNQPELTATVPVDAPENGDVSGSNVDPEGVRGEHADPEAGGHRPLHRFVAAELDGGGRREATGRQGGQDHVPRGGARLAEDEGLAPQVGKMHRGSPKQ